MIFNPGDVIVRGKYQIVDLLGKGGFGEVYKARDTTLEREVAIKVIQRAAAGSTAAEFQDYEARFIQEAKIGAQIRDENVIAVYALEEHGGDLKLLVTEYAAGGSLAIRIASKPFTPEETVELGIQICKGLDSIHRPPLNGVHRDIKPSNILYDQLGRLKVADLGLVQVYGLSGARSVGMGGAQPGTPGYMSPEQETETGYLTPASDVYSLGCVLFEALTQKVYQHLPRGTKANSLRSEVPAKLQEVLDKALSVDVTLRYPDAMAMRQALEAVQKVGAARTDVAPYQFRAGEKAHSPEEWATLADKYWEDGRYALNQGSLEQWLQTMNRADLSAQVSEIRRKYSDADLALEQTLNLLNHKLEQPQLLLDKSLLDFGQVERGQGQSVHITISNPKRGLLYGALRPMVPWVRVPRPTIKCLGGQTQVLEVLLDSANMSEGMTRVENILDVVTYSGKASLAGQVSITWAAGLLVTPGRLNFGEQMAGGDETSLRVESLTVRNKGGGSLQGDISTAANWLAIIPAHFELESGKEISIQLTADLARLNSLGIFSADVVINSNAGARSIQASITKTSVAYIPATRWQKWGLYMGLLLFVLAGWAVPLAFGLRWLLDLQPAPPPWQIVALGIWSVLAWVVALSIPRPLARPLDEIENFYHRGSLADEIPGRRPAFLLRLLFGLLVGGSAAWLASLQGDRSFTLLPIPGLRFAVPILWLAAGAGFLFGFLTVNSRKAGKEFKLADRLWAGPRAVLVAVTFALMVLSISYFGTRSWDMIWLLALGLVMAGDNFASLPLRLQWCYARLRPILPALLLMGLFFFWARAHFLSGNSANLVSFYGIRAINLFSGWYIWWIDLLYLLGVLVLGWVGLFFNNAREDGVRLNGSASLAALLIGGIPALFGFLAVAIVAGVLKVSYDSISFFGILGLIAVLGLAGLAFWLVGGRRQWLNRILNVVFTRLAALFSKVPGLARRPASNPARGSQHAGLGDYLIGNAAIPSTAAMLALAMIAFSLPATYGVLRTILQFASNIGLAVLLVLLCLLVPVALVAGAYLLWRQRQQKK